MKRWHRMSVVVWFGCDDMFVVGMMMFVVGKIMSLFEEYFDACAVC